MIAELLLTALGLAVGVVLVYVWRAPDRRAWRELAQVVRSHPIGTQAPTDLVVGSDWSVRDGRT